MSDEQGKRKPSSKVAKRPSTSSDQEENPIRDDSGDEGKYAAEQQEGLGKSKQEPPEPRKP